VNKLIRQLFFILILNFQCISFAQVNEVQQVLLAEVLSTLEKRYQISFSYTDDTIENKYALLPRTSISLSEALIFVENNSDVVFEVLNDRFVVVKGKAGEVVITDDLKEIFITNYLAAGISKNLDGSIEVKTENLGVLPGLIETDVLQIVQAVPGVFSVSESISDLNIRGGTHDQNLILFDGIRMYQTGHFFGLISAFNPNLKHDISLSKSGSHPKYGDGVSSVIDIKLPNEITGKELKVGLGVNLLNVDFSTTIPISKTTELQLAARRSITDFLNTPTYDNYFTRAFQDSDLENIKRDNSIISKEEDFRFHDLYGKFIWDLTKKDKFKIVFLNIENDLSYEESLLEADRDQDFNSRLNQSNTTVGVTYEKQWNDNLDFKVHSYYSNYELNSNNADILNVQNLLQENRVEDNGFKFDADYRLNKKITFSSGYQFTQVAVSNVEDIDNPLFRRSVKEVILTHALYGLFSYSSDKMELKTGIRANYFEKFNRFIAEPRVTFNYKLAKYIRLNVTGDFKSQSITQVIDDGFLRMKMKRLL